MIEVKRQGLTLFVDIPASSRKVYFPGNRESIPLTTYVCAALGTAKYHSDDGIRWFRLLTKYNYLIERVGAINDYEAVSVKISIRFNKEVLLYMPIPWTWEPEWKRIKRIKRRRF